MPDLTGKVYIVTGGNGGIGLGMAEGIAMAGGNIAIWGRNDAKNQEALGKLRTIGIKAEAYLCDVGDETAIVDTMKRTVDDFGRLDLQMLDGVVRARSLSTCLLMIGVA